MHAYVIYFATNIASLIIDCFVTEMLPIAISSELQFVDTCALWHVKNVSKLSS